MSTTEFSQRHLVRDDVTTTTPPVPTSDAAAHRGCADHSRLGRGRAWALAGPLAAVLATVGSIVADLGNPVYDAATSGDAGKVVAVLAEHRVALTAYHVLVSAAAVLLLVFAAGLTRRLRLSLPATSMLPGLAGLGVAVTAVMQLMGTALDTEVIEAVGRPESFVDETAALYAHWIGTVPYLWTAVGLSGLAVAAAALRHRALPRWVGVAGLVLGALTVLAGVSPLEYMAGLPGTIWAVVTGLGLAVGDRAFRGGNASPAA